MEALQLKPAVALDKSSQITGFYRRSLSERIDIVADWANLSAAERNILEGAGGLSHEQADYMIENAVGQLALPLGIATNFLINGRDYLIPMVIEEPSVLAAVSFAAKMFRQDGGFITASDAPIMIGQIQILDLDDLDSAERAIYAHRLELLTMVNEIGGSIVNQGGGARNIEVRQFPETAIGPMLIAHLLYDVCDAMGANAINTAVEHIAPRIAAITGGRVNLRILSNLTDQRKAYAEGKIPADALAREGWSGEQVVNAIVEAGIFAEVDPYRAATHNKGIMNGIDAVVIATGNDWRAVEAGAHAYAARNGSYASLTKWWKDEVGNLRGSIELPLSVGIVGGATRVHPTAQVAMKILHVQSARELSEVIATVGLAQNFAAIRALATDGIQRGHMQMHARQLAIAAGAPDHLLSLVTQKMKEEGNIRLERAKALVEELNLQGQAQ